MCTSVNAMRWLLVLKIVLCPAMTSGRRVDNSIVYNSGGSAGGHKDKDTKISFVSNQDVRG